MTDKDILEKVLALGASKACILENADFVLSDTFRDICEKNACGAYNTCYMCPPDVGDIHELMAKVKNFDKGILFQYIGNIEDSLDIEGMGKVGNEHHALCVRVKRALRDELPDALFLGSGGCNLCETCGKLSGVPCRHPEDTMPSMESCGFDVYQTTKGTELKYINGQNTVTFFGMVLINE